MKLIPTLRRRRTAVPARRHCCEVLEPRCLLAADPTTFAVIGDYGFPVGRDEQVAAMVKSWDPALVLTVGDNNYPTGSADTIDYNIGRLYHDYIYNYQGDFGAGSPTRRFLPALGNHDWGEPDTNADGVAAYTNY